MNGSLAANAALLSGIQSNLGSPSCDVAVCAPAPYLAQCRTELSDSAIAWGALHTLICIGLVNALVWYGRLHIKVIQPVTEA